MATITNSEVYHISDPPAYCCRVQCSDGIWYTDECWEHNGPYSGEEALALARARRDEWLAKIGESCPWNPEPTTSCTASFQETSANVGDTIHADFTWTDAKKHSSQVFSAMYIINPSGQNKAVALNYVYTTGSKTLSCVTDAVGTWTCRIAAWDGSEWIEATDTIYVSAGPSGNAQLTYFNIAPNPVPIGDSTTVYTTGQNIGGVAGNFCIGIWSEQHGNDWSEWFWVEPGDYFQYARILSNVQYEQSCAAIIWWWDGSQSVNVDEKWLTIYISGNVDMHIRPQSIFYTGPFNPVAWEKIAHVEFENLGNVPDDAILAWYDLTDGPPGDVLGSAFLTNIIPGNIYSYDIFNNIPDICGGGAINLFGDTNEHPQSQTVEGYIFGLKAQMGPSSGIGQSITVRLGHYTTTAFQVKCALYRVSDNSLVGSTEEKTIVGTGTRWYEFIFNDPKPSLSANELYYICVWSSTSDIAGEYCAVSYESDIYDPGVWWSGSEPYGSWPQPWGPPGEWGTRRTMSIYCTYVSGLSIKTLQKPVLSGNHLKKLSICYKPASWVDWDYLGTHFDMVSCSRSAHNPGIQYIKESVNPNLIALGYYDTILENDYYGDWSFVNTKENWFVHANSGERIYIQQPGYRSYLMNPTLNTTPGEEYTSWPDYYAKKSSEFLTASPHYDGIFADDTSTDMVEGGMCPVFNLHCNQWTMWDPVNENLLNWNIDIPRPQNLMYLFLQNLQNTIPTGKVMPNAWKYTEYCQDITHMCVWEHFVHGKVHDYTHSGYGELYTRYAIETIHDQAILDNIVAVISGTQNPETNPAITEEWVKFTMACFLFAVENMDKSYYAFNFWGDAGETDPHNGYWPIMDYIFGNPVQSWNNLPDLNIIDSVYAREFENAFVVANISPSLTSNFTINSEQYQLPPRRALFIEKQAVPSGTWEVGVKLYGTEEPEPSFDLELGKIARFKVKSFK